MNEYHFDAEVMLSGRAVEAEREALGERVYATDAGSVRVRAEWTASDGAPVTRVALRVVDERESGDARDIPAFVELFFHDAFLLFNLASPGSFGGVVSVSGGDYRVNEIALDARMFEYASASLAALPLRDVVRWYDSLQNGTRQLATDGVTKALFHLLHLARGPENDDMTVIRLAQSAEALALPIDELATLRDAIVRGTGAVVHPMMDDSLDPALDAIDWTGVIDDVAGRVIGTLQSLARA